MGERKKELKKEREKEGGEEERATVYGFPRFLLFTILEDEDHFNSH